MLHRSNARPQRRKEKTVALTLISGFLAVAGCKPNLDPDSIKLDGTLSGTEIDRVDLVSTVFNSKGVTIRTNTLTGTELTKFLVSLTNTNRINSPDASKDQMELTAYLMHGTNALCSLDLFENGLWKFGNYSFRTRSIP